MDLYFDLILIYDIFTVFFHITYSYLNILYFMLQFMIRFDSQFKKITKLFTI